MVFEICAGSWFWPICWLDVDLLGYLRTLSVTISHMNSMERSDLRLEVCRLNEDCSTISVRVLGASSDQQVSNADCDAFS